MLLVPCRFDRYRVVARGGVAVYANPSHSSPVIYHFAQDDEMSVDGKTDENGMVWVHHAHGLGADDILAGSPQIAKPGAVVGSDQRVKRDIDGDGQGWIPILSKAGQIQMQQLERRKPVRLIQAAGERSFAFTGDKKPLRRHLSQI
jgi:hypothetical protein